MATVLGKRRARAQADEARPEADQDKARREEEARRIFQQHFEAQFAPLEPSQTTAKGETGTEIEDLRSDSEEDDDDDDSSEDSWGGVSEPDSADPSDDAVEVVAHTNAPPALSSDPLSRRESKAYLSSRVPSSLLDPSSTSSSSTTKSSSKSKSAPTDEDAPSLLKNDLALQRLLSESHLFAGPGSNSGSGSTEHAGRNRHLATDLRLAALGSRDSIFRQARMPMAHRKGISAAASAREARRRHEARENGVVLERPAAAAQKNGGGGGGKAARVRRRQGGGGGGDVGAPAVGRMSNGRGLGQAHSGQDDARLLKYFKASQYGLEDFATLIPGERGFPNETKCRVWFGMAFWATAS
ncbi:hypothetical protein GGR52DRAFT_567152 [Hypoxylon sp. FL1284]|nr:hypothetical protein GGR52DRAFT_567152 [Hypoxylon sp. FL1284]